MSLADTLERLHANGHPFGLDRATARALEDELLRGESLEVAAPRAALDPRLVLPVTLAGSKDVPATLVALLEAASEASSHELTLRSAAFYPLALAFSIAVAGGVVYGALAPVLSLVPLGAGPTPAHALVAASALSILVLLAVAVLTRVRVPFLADAWQRVEAFELLQRLVVLVEGGTPLPRALKASAAGTSGPIQQAAQDLARALEAGGDPPRSAPLLDSFETRMLVVAAGNGALGETLPALVDRRRQALRRDVPEQATRIQLVALGMAAVALLAVGLGFFTTYGAALGGP